jgi:shikimate kinase
VVLIGMMGAGKTAIGGQLARVLGAPFVDSDEEIVKAANMSVAEIFARDGEAFFRQKESQVLARLLDGPPVVLSTGGGAFLSAANRQLISRRGISVWLDADLELLWQRVRHRSTRPLLKVADPRGTLSALMKERGPIYALADLTVKAEPGASIAATTQQVLAALATRPDVVEGR